MNQLAQIVVSGMILGSVYALTALGFSIVYNATRVVNFAHGEFVMMGGLVTAALTVTLGMPPLASAAASVLLVTGLGVLLDRVAIQHARRKEQLTLVMITIGAASVFRGLMEIVVGRDIYFMPAFPGPANIGLGGLYIPGQGLWIVVTLVVVAVLLWFLFRHTLLGKAMRAASGNGRAAQLYGIDPRVMSALSYGLAGGIGAIAGAVVTPLASGYYQTGLYFGLKGFAATILGGLGNPLGAIVGGLLIGLMESVAAGYVSSGYKDSIALGILLLVMLFRPSGLFGHVEAVRV
jgi:branched-chain amino acid transport system permease protein